MSGGSFFGWRSEAARHGPASAGFHADTLGLRVVWNGKPGIKVEADLVAVHGLAGGSSSTYLHENGSDLLTDLIAHDEELRNIRILTFGYAAADAYYVNRESRSSGRVTTFAEQLCYDLRNIRVDLKGLEEHRPIIFLAHGIGGIVIKQALVDNKDIMRCTSHILFFDTPHRGFDIEAWTDVVDQAMTTGAELQFAVGSTALSELDRSFAGMAGSNQLLSFSTFYSSKPCVTRNGGKWAIKEAHTILGNDNEKCCQLDHVCHMTMLKYPNASDQMYRRIKMCLRQVLLRLPSDGMTSELVLRENRALQKSHANEISSRILTWLSSYDHVTNQQRLSAMRLPNTAKWILSEDNFSNWLRTSTSSCLWCSGKLGSGKTIICSSVVQEVRSRFSSAADVAVVHVYCQYDEPGTWNTPRIVSSLIKQLILQLEAIAKPIESTVQDKLKQAHRQGRARLDAEEGFEILLGLTRKFSQVYIVLDGLDELTDDKQRVGGTSDEVTALLRLVKRLLTHKSRTLLKLFLSSRFEVDVRKSIPSSLEISLLDSNVNRDIEVFVEEEVEDKIWAAGLTDDRDLADEIKLKLVSGAQGMFLWAKLQVQALCEDCNSDTMFREALDDLPVSIHEIYHRCLLRIITRKGNLACAPQVLQWVACAKRPMLAGELKEAINIKIGDSRWEESKGRMATSLLINSCGGLVYHDEFEGTIRLVHPSAKKYMFSEKSETKLGAFNLDLYSADLDLGHACLTYLAFSDFSTQVTLRSSAVVSRDTVLPNPQDVIKTAATPWAAGLITKVMVNSKNLAPKKLRSEISRRSVVPDHMVSMYRFLDYARAYWTHHTKRIDHSSALFSEFQRLAIEPNRVWMLQPWLREDNSRFCVEDLFEWAMNNQHIPLLRILVEIDKKWLIGSLSKRMLRNGRIAIHHAAAEGLVEVIRFFLSLETALDALTKTDSQGCTPLHHAAGSSQAGAVDILLQYPATREYSVKSPFSFGSSECLWIDLVAGDGETALYKAVASGNSVVVRLLREHSASSTKHRVKIKAQAPFSPSLLYLAAREDFPSAVQELLYFGYAAIEIREVLKEAAVKRNHPLCVEVLVKWSSSRGEDPDPTDEALSFAIEHNILDVLTPLLHFRDNPRLSRIIEEEYLLRLIEREKTAALEIFLGFKERASVTRDNLQSLLHRCIRNPKLVSTAYIGILLPHGVDINGKVDGESPLFTAVSANNVGALSTLLNLGADRNPLSDRTTLSGQVIQYANSTSDVEQIGQYVSMLSALLQYGFDANEISLFWEAREYENEKIPVQMPLLECAVIAQNPTMVKTLLEFGAHSTSKDGTSKPLLKAIKTGQADTATVLLESGADINSKYILDALYRDHALSRLESQKWPIILPILVKFGFKINQQLAPRRRTLLMLTFVDAPGRSQEAWAIIVKAFKDNGADLDIVDSTHQTATDLAEGLEAEAALREAGGRYGIDIVVENCVLNSLLLWLLLLCLVAGFAAWNSSWRVWAGFVALGAYLVFLPPKIQMHPVLEIEAADGTEVKFEGSVSGSFRLELPQSKEFGEKELDLDALGIEKAECSIPRSLKA
ncbi:ankyrin [Cadophora sp. DSE1049]|nr:ankyrin [Cadophora sp. DSE1049]